MKAEKPYITGDVSRRGTGPEAYVVNVSRTGFTGTVVLTLTGAEKELVRIAGDAVVAALNKASGA